MKKSIPYIIDKNISLSELLKLAFSDKEIILKDSLSIERKRNLIKKLAATGKLYSLSFYKRSTNLPRTIITRGKLKNFIPQGEKRYKDKDYDLITILDIKDLIYKSIPLDTLYKINGINF